MGFEVIRGYKKKYTGIRDSLHFLGFDCFSYGLNTGFYIPERNAILIAFIAILILAIFN